ncbi:MAG: ribonuclease III [Lachnospiraceae bacterium]|nr:ribonuclease III [Lachnospiraceae bacterium]
MGLNQDIINHFDGKEIDIKTYSPLTLAYIGDDVFDLIIRTIVVNRGNTKPAKLHGATVKYVSAVAQAKMHDTISELLNEEEADILRRGRNANPHTKAKNASSADYMKATALETLVGFLYLKDEQDRIFELLQKGIEVIDKADERQ